METNISNKCKAFTSLEQSKKLAEILPIESADMGYIPSAEDDNGNTLYTAEFKSEFIFDEDSCIHCWSLAALLNSVKYNTINLHYNDVRNDWIASCTVEHSTRYESGRALNPIDACVEMILKLNELNLL